MLSEKPLFSGGFIRSCTPESDRCPAGVMAVSLLIFHKLNEVNKSVPMIRSVLFLYEKCNFMHEMEDLYD